VAVPSVLKVMVTDCERLVGLAAVSPVASVLCAMEKELKSGTLTVVRLPVSVPVPVSVSVPVPVPVSVTGSLSLQAVRQLAANKTMKVFAKFFILSVKLKLNVAFSKLTSYEPRVVCKEHLKKPLQTKFTPCFPHFFLKKF
jgi:hypothetical protein